MEKLIYFEINLTGIIICSIILFYQKKQAYTTMRQKIYNILIITVICILFFDGGMWLIDGTCFEFSKELNIFFTTSYFILNCVAPYFWFQYTVFFYNDKKYINNIKYIMFTSIPLSIYIIITIISILTNNTIFIISQDNVYHRGPHIFTSVLIPFIYIIASFAIDVYYFKISKTTIKRKESVLMAALLALPTAGAIIQMEFFSLNLIWILSAISMLIIFINFQNYQMRTDYLTKLYNRQYLEKYLESFNEKDNTEYSIIMLDVDKFKYVNDHYGHMNGDKILIAISEILKIVCINSNSFISRFGGDEFIIVCKKEFSTQIRKNITEYTQMFKDKNMPDYILSVSVGEVTFKNLNNNQIDYLISTADKLMYQDKNNKRIQIKR